MSRPLWPLNISLLTASITWPVRTPLTMLISAPWEGSYSTPISGLLTVGLKNACPALTPKSLGIMNATVALPLRTAARAKLQRGGLYVQILIGGQAADNLAGNCAGVLVDGQDGNAAGFG